MPGVHHDYPRLAGRFLIIAVSAPPLSGREPFRRTERSSEAVGHILVVEQVLACDEYVTRPTDRSGIEQIRDEVGIPRRLVGDILKGASTKRASIVKVPASRHVKP